MHPKKHLFYGTLFSLIVFLFFDVSLFNVFVIWLSSWFLIDLDHAIRYVFLTKNINPVGFWKWSKEKNEKWKKLSKTEKEKYKIPLFIFHGVEPLIVLGILSFYYSIFLYVFIGVLFHLIFDLVNLYNREENVLGKVSIIYILIYNRNKKIFRF